MIRSCLLALSLAGSTAALPALGQEPAAPDSIYQLAQVEVRPGALNGGELGAALFARYPASLKAAGVSGEVTVSMVVGTDGLPRNLELVSTTDTLFNGPTLEVVSLLRFSPAQMGGRPVPVRIVVPVAWEAGPVTNAPGPDALGAYELGEVDVPPRPTKGSSLRVALEPGDVSLPEGAERFVTVQVRTLVNPDGTLSHTRVTRSTNEWFDAPTLDALEEFRFTPARLGSRPVPVWVEFPIHWSDGDPRPDLDVAYTFGLPERMPQPTNVPVLQRALERLYPRELRNGGITGTVQVRFRVDREGMVENAVVTSSTDERFNEATLTAIQVLRFRPAQVGRKRVAVWVEIPLQWVTDSAPRPERPAPGQPGEPG